MSPNGLLAGAGWNINGIQNGLWRAKRYHQGCEKQSHDIYNIYVTDLVGKWLKDNPGANGVQIKNYLEGLSGRLRKFLNDNPKSELDKLFDVFEI